MLLFHPKYTIGALALTIALLLSLWLVENALFGVVALILWCVFFGYALGLFLLPDETRGWQTFWGLLGLLALGTLLLTGIYWFFSFTPQILADVLIGIPLLIGLQKKHP